MEQLFNPQLPGGGRPDIQLCIFPHLPEFLVIAAREENPQVLVLSTDDVFSQEFYQTVESEFSEILRSSSESLFSHLVNLPIVIDETVRDIAMTFILDRLGVQVDDGRPDSVGGCLRGQWRRPGRPHREDTGRPK